VPGCAKDVRANTALAAATTAVGQVRCGCQPRCLRPDRTVLCMAFASLRRRWRALGTPV